MNTGEDILESYGETYLKYDEGISRYSEGGYYVSMQSKYGLIESSSVSRTPNEAYVKLMHTLRESMSMMVTMVENWND